MREYASGIAGHFVTDPDYPGVVGKGRTTAEADKDFDRVKEVTWHERRIAGIQLLLDKILGGEVLDREEYMQLQIAIDDFVGLLREKGNMA